MVEESSDLGTTFTGIRSVLIHYEIKGYAIREGVKKLRQAMRVNNMQFPFTTMNNNIMGLFWKHRNHRPDPIHTALSSFDIEWLNNIPKGQTPETYPYLKWFWGDRLITPKKPYLYLQSTNAGDQFRSIWEGIEGKQIFTTIDPNDNWYDQYKEDWINGRTGGTGLYRVFQPAYHEAKNTYDKWGLPIQGQAHWDSQGMVDCIHFKKITPELGEIGGLKFVLPKEPNINDRIHYADQSEQSFDGSEYKVIYDDFDWIGVNNNLNLPERGILIKSRAYGMHAFYLKMAQTLTLELTIKDKAKDLVARTYSTVNPIHDIELSNQPFWKNIKSKGGKKNKKNWR